MTGSQAPQRRHVVREVRHRAIDQVAGDCNEIGFQGVYRIDDGCNVVVPDLGADVHVADLCDGEPVQCRRQVRQGHLDVDDASPSARPAKPTSVTKTARPAAIAALAPCSA